MGKRYTLKDKEFLPPKFLEMVRKILPEDEMPDFIRMMNTRLRKCIRINTLKAKPKAVLESLEKEGFVLEKMPWYKYGFFINERPEDGIKLGNTLEHFLGHFYVQEASSMLPVIALDPEENENILDMAASPGSKTTQIAMHMKNTGMVVANEPQMSRLSTLQVNLERSGVMNHFITRNDGRYFNRLPDTFNKVLVDAPCSVEGTFRKDLKARFIWAPNKVNQLSVLQYELLVAGIETAKKDSTIVYSTCTISPEENEMVINRILKEGKVKLEKVKFKGIDDSKGLTNYNNVDFDKELKKTVRVWPHKNDMEGFFLAKMTKL